MKRYILIVAAVLLLLTGCAAKPETEFNVITSTYMPAEEELPLADAPEEPEATEVPRDALSVKDGVYTIAWLTDTQHYSAKYPDSFKCMTNFLKTDGERMGLKYVVHTGDIVNDEKDGAQWIAADEAMDALSGIPHGVLAGNHDLGDSGNYAAYFGEDRFSGSSCYGGSFENNLGHYDLIDVGNTKYIFVYLSYAPSNAAIKWANGVFAEHRDRVGILAVHEYFDSDSNLTEAGQMLFDKVVAKNPNIYMVLCGHRYTVNCIEAAFDDNKDGTPERTVYQMIANYQAAGDMGGDGYMRFMQVDENEGVIRMYTYSPVLRDFTYFDDAEHAEEKYAADPANEEFVVPIPWR